MKTVYQLFLFRCIAFGLLGLGLLHETSLATGTLDPLKPLESPIQIRDHHVQVTINNGFAQTTISQTFFNPNTTDLEAFYRFPLPKSASLSEVTLTLGEQTIHGEVVAREQAETIYQAEKQQGNNVALATKESYQSFDFKVHPVRANSETRIQIVYYQPISVDTGVVKYLYPLEDGGTDEVAKSFWDSTSDKVEGLFSAEFEIKSALPIKDIRVPGFENSLVTDRIADGHYKIRIEQKDFKLNQDLICYYRLADDLPGRVELVAFRDDAAKPGHFMMVVTPGIDLQPINSGADYVYILDTSGSMNTKLATLIDGVTKAIGNLSDQDRYRVITFSNQATDQSGGWKVANAENVQRTLNALSNLASGGSTNLYDGLNLGLSDLDNDRATSVILVTDGVTNQGIVEPKKFHELTSMHDIRIFGFLLGNNSNWPLMRTICDASGGFYAGVSNADDIYGQVLLAKSKITYESLHDASFKIKGVKTFDLTNQNPGKIYRGEQLIMFGRYSKGGKATLTLDAKLTGKDRIYQTTFDFPDIDTANPEIERLWAMDQIENIQAKRDRGDMIKSESSTAIQDLGIQYQLVTDETSMLVLSDASFQKHQIKRLNTDRIKREHVAQAKRASAPAPSNHRVDTQQPLTPNNAPRINSGSRSGGGGGGALPPIIVLLMAAFSALAVRLGLKK